VCLSLFSEEVSAGEVAEKKKKQRQMLYFQLTRPHYILILGVQNADLCPPKTNMKYGEVKNKLL